jgi:hypothetical protein
MERSDPDQEAWLGMTDENPPEGGIDVTRPSVDRDMGSRIAEVNPALHQLVRQNREFICAAAARAAAAGISQFLDLGSGLPSHPAVYEAVREVIPDARVCYVDIEPNAVLHGETLLARGEGLAAAQADLADPDAVLANPHVRAVIDMAQPTALILAAVPHFMSANEAAALCGDYMRRAAPGSWLIVSSGHYQDKELASRLQETATHTRFRNHSAADLASMLGGLDPGEPGPSGASGASGEPG